MANNPYAAPVSALPISGAARRPATVVAAVCAFAGSYAIGLLDVVIKQGVPRYPPVIGGMIIAALIAAAFLAALYFRRNLARWVIVIITAYAVVVTPGRLSVMAQLSDQLVFAAQGALQLAGAILLLLPVSGRWFRPGKTRGA